MLQNKQVSMSEMCRQGSLLPANEKINTLQERVSQRCNGFFVRSD
jgi:hypothetical protein